MKTALFFALGQESPFLLQQRHRKFFSPASFSFFLNWFHSIEFKKIKWKKIMLLRA